MYVCTIVYVKSGHTIVYTIVQTNVFTYVRTIVYVKTGHTIVNTIVQTNVFTYVSTIEYIKEVVQLLIQLY